MEPEPELRKEDSIMIFQHPKGRQKEYSQDKITNIEKPFVFYQADTETGSSGSPVLTTVGLKLIAIHHKGSEEGGYNKGTLISEVLMHLEKETCMFISVFFFLWEWGGVYFFGCNALCKEIFHYTVSLSITLSASLETRRNLV